MIISINGDSTRVEDITKIFGGTIAGLQDNVHGEKFKLFICTQNEDRTNVEIIFTAPSERVESKLAAICSLNDETYWEIEDVLPTGFLALPGVQDRIKQTISNKPTGFSAKKIMRLFSWGITAI
jgi:hypothetical protein